MGARGIPHSHTAQQTSHRFNREDTRGWLPLLRRETEILDSRQALYRASGRQRFSRSELGHLLCRTELGCLCLRGWGCWFCPLHCSVGRPWQLKLLGDWTCSHRPPLLFITDKQSGIGKGGVVLSLDYFMLNGAGLIFTVQYNRSGRCVSP